MSLCCRVDLGLERDVAPISLWETVWGLGWCSYVWGQARAAERQRCCPSARCLMTACFVLGWESTTPEANMDFLKVLLGTDSGMNYWITHTPLRVYHCGQSIAITHWDLHISALKYSNKDLWSLYNWMWNPSNTYTYSHMFVAAAKRLSIYWWQINWPRECILPPTDWSVKHPHVCSGSVCLGKFWTGRRWTGLQPPIPEPHATHLCLHCSLLAPKRNVDYLKHEWVLTKWQ